jgi:hypothetical protein
MIDQPILDVMRFAVRDAGSAASALVPVQIWLLNEASCPDDVLELLHQGLKDHADAPEHEVSLLRILGEFWDVLTKKQMIASLKILEGLYGRIEAWFPCFVIADILGHQIRHSEVFETLVRMAAAGDETRRALSAHGLGYAVHLEDGPARRRAFELLQSLNNDRSERVRVETETALRKWGESK